MNGAGRSARTRPALLWTTRPSSRARVRPQRPPIERRSSAARSVARVALFLPWVSVVVVAVCLPEAGLVGRLETEAPYPLGALPEVVVRNEHAGGAPVLGREQLTFVGEDHPRF